MFLDWRTPKWSFVLLSCAHFHTFLPKFWLQLPEVTPFLFFSNLFYLCASISSKPEKHFTKQAQNYIWNSCVRSFVWFGLWNPKVWTPHSLSLTPAPKPVNSAYNLREVAEAHHGPQLKTFLFLKLIHYTYIKILVGILSELAILFLDQEAEDFGSVDEFDSCWRKTSVV